MGAISGFLTKRAGVVQGPGTGTSDSISARLSNGEFVLPADTVRKIGVDTLNALVAATHRPVRRKAGPSAAARMADGGPIEPRRDQPTGATAAAGAINVSRQDNGTLSFSGGNVSGAPSYSGAEAAGFKPSGAPVNFMSSGPSAAAAPSTPSVTAVPVAAAAAPAIGAPAAPAGGLPASAPAPGAAPAGPAAAAAGAPQLSQYEQELNRRNLETSASSIVASSGRDQARAQLRTMQTPAAAAPAAPGPISAAAAPLPAASAPSPAGASTLSPKPAGSVPAPAAAAAMSSPAAGSGNSVTDRFNRAASIYRSISDSAAKQGTNLAFADGGYVHGEENQPIAAPAFGPSAAVRALPAGQPVPVDVRAAMPLPTDNRVAASGMNAAQDGARLDPSTEMRLAEARQAARARGEPLGPGAAAGLPGLAGAWIPGVNAPASQAVQELTERNAKFDRDQLVRELMRRGGRGSAGAISAIVTAPGRDAAELAAANAREAGATERARMQEAGENARAQAQMQAHAAAQAPAQQMQQERLQMERQRLGLEQHRTQREDRSAELDQQRKERIAALEALVQNGTPEQRQQAAQTLAAYRGREIPGVGKAMPGSAAAGLLTNMQNLRRAQNAFSLLSGKAVDGVQGDTEATGVKGFVPNTVLNRLDPQGVDTRAAIADLGSLVIHDRSGAAVTAAEFPRLAPFIPQASDDPATARKKLAGFIRNYQAVVDDQVNFYTESGYKVPAQVLKQGGSDEERPQPAPRPGAVPNAGATPAASQTAAAPATPAAGAQRTIARTGTTKDGRKVIQYSDGSISYAN